MEEQAQSLLGRLEELTVDDLKTRQQELTSLNNSVGWALYRSVLDAQLETRKRTVFHTPCKSIDETLAQEFLKGEGSGIYQTMTLIELLIEALDEELNSRKFNKEDT